MDLPSSEASEPFPDQRTGLIILGAIQILAGAGAIVMAALMVLLTLSELSTSVASMIPAAIFYLTLGAISTTLGVGSILARRWARDLTLVASWAAIAFGTFLTIMMALIMPRISTTVPGGEALPQALVWITTAVSTVFWIGVPALYAWFYGRESTRVTCQVRDRRTRWTESIPLPLLGAALILLISGFWSLFAFANPVLPLGPTILRGLPASLVSASLGIAMMVIAVGLLRRSHTSWLALMALLVIGIVTGAWTFASLDVRAYYAVMTEQYQTDVPPELFDIYTSPVILGAVALAWIAWLIFAFSLRRHVAAPAS